MLEFPKGGVRGTIMENIADCTGGTLESAQSLSHAHTYTHTQMLLLMLETLPL